MAAADRLGFMPMLPMSGGDSSQMSRLEQGMAEGLDTVFKAESGLPWSDSMEVTNDPRFFQDNVLNARLTAFGALSVVSGLMVQNALNSCLNMKKHMDITSIRSDPDFPSDQLMQLVAFFILGLVLFFNVIATYVGVVQPYHTIRLMTGGPTGFEAAAVYYLNKTVAFWRHLAVNCALISLPLFLISSGLRMLVKFDWENEQNVWYWDDNQNWARPLGKQGASSRPEPAPPSVHTTGIVMCCYFLFMAATLFYAHFRHVRIFNDRYGSLRLGLVQHNEALGTMHSGRWAPAPASPGQASGLLPRPRTPRVAC